jgi:hypothetical protein
MPAGGLFYVYTNSICAAHLHIAVMQLFRIQPWMLVVFLPFPKVAFCHGGIVGDGLTKWLLE